MLFLFYLFCSFWAFFISEFYFSLENSSAEQLVDIGCQWVILGHSERRHVIGEDDQVVADAAEFLLIFLVHLRCIVAAVMQ